MHRLLPARGGGDKVFTSWWPPASSSNHLSTSSVLRFQRVGERAGGGGETVSSCRRSGRDAADVRVADNKRRAGAPLVFFAIFALFFTSATTRGRSLPRLLVGKRGDPPVRLHSGGAFKEAAATATTSSSTTTITATTSSPSAVDDSASNATPPPVVIALMNRFYFGDRYARVVPGCTWGKTVAILPCEFTADQARINESSALA